MRGLIPRVMLFLLLCSAFVAAADSPPVSSYFWPPATDIAIFKDGCAYVVREGEAEVDTAGVLTERIPRPVLGTLDIYSRTEGVSVAEVVAYYDQIQKVSRIADVESFYRAQIGRRIALECGAAKCEGVLRAVLAPGHLLLETGAGSELVPIASVTRLSLPDQAALETTGQGRQPRFRIRLAGDPPRRVRLGLSYLEESWAWFPSYRVNLLPNDLAELILSATVVDNAEDVHGAILHLIVGVPNFMMRGTLSPMVLDVDTGALTRASARPAQVMTDALRYAAEMKDGAEDYSPAAPAGPVEDLFVYEKRNFALGQGERMQFELFRCRVPCAPIYKWDVPIPDSDRVYNQNYLQQRGVKLQGEQAGEIWHYFRLTNGTTLPWTTAPALVVSGWQAVAQDLMAYVPAGSYHDLRVTIAADLKGKAVEEEVARKVVRLFENDDYLQITVRGTLTLENFKKERVLVEVAKSLWGEIREAGGGKVTKGAAYLWNVNPHSRLEWHVELSAGGKKVLTYTYDLYVNV